MNYETNVANVGNGQRLGITQIFHSLSLPTIFVSMIFRLITKCTYDVALAAVACSANTSDHELRT